MKLFIASCIAILCLVHPAHAQPAGVFDDPLPQAQSNDCQSYSIMLALSKSGHPQYELDTAAELRAAELDFRRALEAAATPNEPATSHQLWIDVLTQYTSGQATLHVEYLDELSWIAQVAEITGVSDVSSPVDKIFLASGRYAMTSVKEMAGSAYGSGHIVTVMGVNANGNSSPTDAIFFNSAFKGADTQKVTCSADDLPGDSRYYAGVLATSDYQLTSFNGKFLLMWIE